MRPKKNKHTYAPILKFVSLLFDRILTENSLGMKEFSWLPGSSQGESRQELEAETQIETLEERCVLVRVL